MRLLKGPFAGRRGAHRARGAAVVEFAVVLPLLLTILFGIIEYGWIFMVRQTLQQAAREGCRVAILQASTPADVEARVDDVMGAASLAGYTTLYTPSLPGDDPPIETVSVSIAYDSVSLVGGFFGFGGYDLGGICRMRLE